MCGKVLLISAVLVGLVSLSSCRSLGELNEHKTYSSMPHYGGSPTPTHGSGGGYKPTPTPTPTYGATPTPTYGATPTPTYGATPTPSYGTTPSTPSTPSHDVPTIPKKHELIGSCDYWKGHPDAIVAAIGSLGNIGQTFGAACSMIVGKKLENLHDALSNTRTDGIGALIREGAAAYLNSIVNKKFPFTTQQVKDCIVVAVISEGAASAQAGVFKKANDSHYKF
ncbi:protodermal factor 1-like [Lolium rigidum]|uniref:protodermal factor 1-like n=1 Tax=Lolium rigidum TaxID=89674 RepID=UPI001F5C0AC7|nr:protodermal factor 1-like [Lolium rigidum]